MNFEKNERYPSIFLIILSTIVCITSLRLGIGTVHAPGSGFFPFWSGILLGLLSLANFLIDSAKSKLFVKEHKEQQEDRINWKNLLLTFAFLLVYPFLLSTVGFLLSTFLFFSLFLYFIGAKNWPIVFGLSAAVALVSFLIFQHWLKIQFPVGILGI